MEAMRQSWTDERLDDLSANVDRRFDQVDRRFDQVDRRFEQVDRRFEQVDRRFEQVEGQVVSLRQERKKASIRCTPASIRFSARCSRQASS